MELDQQPIKTRPDSALTAKEQAVDKVISIEECKRLMDKFDLSDQKIFDMRNALIGIVDKTLNSYISDFR